ncbi:MAG: 4'-phosphopantetheinyl transferase superfamily protein [Deltaproteobacteria bacterium]|nr:4'-phosphopantetheinyl transferase superfamily protein [Deltaproteobacteria bacterium]
MTAPPPIDPEQPPATPDVPAGASGDVDAAPAGEEQAPPIGSGWGKPYDVVYRDALVHGVVAGVVLPGDGAPVPAWALARLPPEEQEVARGLRNFRQCAYVGGRLAAHAALDGLGLAQGPVLTDARGAPLGPPGVSLSISHKSHLAVAIAARADLGVLGVDLEELGRARPHVARVVLTPVELEAISRLPPERRWVATLLRFSIKEAIYKALAPRLQRYIGFEEAEVSLRLDGTASVTLNLTQGEPPTSLDVRYHWLDGGFLSSVRARWGEPNLS